MAEFSYEARDRFGKLIKGSASGESAQAVSNRLQSAGYIPVRIDLKSVSAGWHFSFFQRVKLRDLNLFTRQLLTLQQAGFPLLAGLRSIEQQCESVLLKEAILHVVIDIESGFSFHEALERQPKVFNELFVRMVEAGEASGKLEDILGRLAFLNERNEETQNKIVTALRYPMLTLTAMAAAFILIITLVIPKFAALFAHFHTELPLPTRILIGLNSFVRNYWLPGGLILGAAANLFMRYTRSERGRLWWDGLLLKAPVFGRLLHEIYMSRFSRNLATLITSGLPILRSLELVANTVNNAQIKKAVEQIHVYVREGRKMSDAMADSDLFSPMVVQMVAIGEETGKVDDLLNHVSDYYDRETDLKIKGLTTLIEPLLICMMGGMVLLLALGVFLPMWNLINLFKRP